MLIFNLEFHKFNAINKKKYNVSKPKVIKAYNEFCNNYFKSKKEFLSSGKVIGIYKALDFLNITKTGYNTEKFINIFLNSLHEAFDIQFVRNPISLFYCENSNYIITFDLSNYANINFEQLMTIAKIDYNRSFEYLIIKVVNNYFNNTHINNLRFIINNISFEFMSSIVRVDSHVFAIINSYNSYYVCNDDTVSDTNDDIVILDYINDSFLFRITK